MASQNISSTSRKTKKAPRARRWCFTLNNYTPEEVSQLLTSKCIKKYIFQEEIGKNNTPHLQGVVEFSCQKTMSAIKKIFPRHHWEICRNWEASVQYCTKSETSVGKVYENIGLDPNKIRKEQQEADHWWLEEGRYELFRDRMINDCGHTYFKDMTIQQIKDWIKKSDELDMKKVY